jgi:hypothetical protein
MTLNYTETHCIVTDDVGNRPALTFLLHQRAEIDAAAVAYSALEVPAPDWERFRTLLQTDNGFPAAWTTILQGDSRAAIMLIASLSVWQASPDQWGQFLAAIGACLLLLPPAQAAEVGLELLVIGQDCHLDPVFLVALEAMLNQGAS